MVDEIPEADDILEEYDFSEGVRGKYAVRYTEGTNVVVVAADLTSEFPDSQSVNQALRRLLRLEKQNRPSR